MPWSPKKQQISPVYRGSLFLLYLCLQFPTLIAGAFQIQGPHEPVVALVGGEAELPCYLLPRQNAHHMQIRWSRFLSSQVVHLYKDGRDQPTEAMKEYSGRTTLVRDAIYIGIVVLRIHNVQPSDNGLYRCGFQHDSFYNDTLIELKVAVLGSDPHFHVEVTKFREIQLECKTAGWFPQPMVQWINSQGKTIPSVSQSHSQDKRGLFQVTTSLLLRDPLKENVTCSVWNQVLNQKKEEQLSIAVAESLAYTLLIAVMATVVLLTLAIIGFCLYKHRQDRIKKPKRRRASKRNSSLWATICLSQQDSGEQREASLP